MERTPVIRMPEESRGVTLKTHPMVFLVTGPQTRHTSMFDWTIPPRFETGLHVHRVQEETFYLIEGACVWHVGERAIEARPGTFVFIPPGVPHNITNPNAADRPRADDRLAPRPRALFRRTRAAQCRWRAGSFGTSCASGTLSTLISYRR